MIKNTLKIFYFIILASSVLVLKPADVFAQLPISQSDIDSINRREYYRDPENEVIVSSCTGSQQGSIVVSELLSLTYPVNLDEASTVTGIKKTIEGRYPKSNWLGLEQWIIDESKKNNVNPLFIVATGGTESGFGDSPAGKNNNNYFGVKINDDTYKSFSTPQDGIIHLIEGLPGYLSGERGFGKYTEVKNIYEYSSVHQTGSIVYPGQPFDPLDQDDKPGNILDLWDPAMGVYISWDETANLRPEVNPKYKGNTYNPLGYYSSNIGFINKITGSNFPQEPSGSANGCSGVLSAGEFGWDLPGEGSNPMAYYSQRSSGTDSSVQGYFGNEPYGPGPISHCGCGPTSWAMIVTTLTGYDVKPPEVALWASQNGWQSPPNDGPCGGSNWWWSDGGGESSEQKWGVSATTINLDGVESALRKGSLVLISVSEGPFTSNGHLLVIRSFSDDGKFYFADPNDYNDTRQVAQDVFNGNSKSRTALSPDQFDYSVNQYWEVQRL